MSTGARIPLARAQAVAAYLIDLWQLEGAHIVGSVRRQRAEVGDLEMVIPAVSPTYSIDSAYLAMEPTLAKTGTSSLFDAPRRDPIGRALRGFNVGFLACSLEVGIKGTTIPVQIYRYTPQNFGWIMLMRTGPADFGKWFLGRWKDRHNIDHKSVLASMNGHLVDRHGAVIPTPTEDDAFALCGLKPLAPERRDEFVAWVQVGAR